MAVTIRHAGLVVQNIDVSIKFYSDLLGLPVASRKIEDGLFIAQIVGIPNVRLEWAKLRDENGIILELLQYHSHPDHLPLGNYPSNRHGASHVAFTVENLDAVYSKLLHKKVHCNSAPQTSPDGKTKVLYCYDPDGIPLELVEEL
jgi:catechol 2,3-dioxygenase-like lactoylglutathione lyase family enzyme